MIIEELKSFLRATILISSDMTKKEFSLELLEKIIAMEQKLKSMEPIEIDPPVTKLPPGVENTPLNRLKHGLDPDDPHIHPSLI
jgi:hypothetical protein